MEEVEVLDLAGNENIVMDDFVVEEGQNLGMKLSSYCRKLEKACALHKLFM